MINQLELTYLEALYQADLDNQREVILARRYHEGDQDTYLTDRVKEFLGLHDKNPFRLNICRTVVMAVKDELDVVGFSTAEDGEKKPIAQWAWDTWTANNMASMQSDVHETALRDRESFIIVDFDNENRRPRFTWHPRYTSMDASSHANNMGVWMIYPDDDDTQPAIAAVKQWVETYDLNGEPYSRMRRTVYYPDRIERFYYNSEWLHYVVNPEDAWPIPWVDGDKKPLGIPVGHFKNAGLRPEAWDAIPMQDAVNKTLIDILATGDMTAFRIFVALGFVPTTDGKPLKEDNSNMFKIAPATIIGTTTTAQNADFKSIDGEDVTPTVNTLKELVLLAAMITDTPVSRFIATSQVSSGDTLRENEKPLKKKAETRRSRFGDAWEGCMDMARKLANLYGAAGLDETITIETLWRHSESLADLLIKKQLGVPQETIWSEMGYSPEQIAIMKNSDEYQAKLALIKAGLGGGSSGG